MIFEVYGISHTGAVRSKNEDNFIFSTDDFNSHIGDQGEIYKIFEGNFVAAVADGMGGLDHGEIASRIAVEQISKLELDSSMDLDKLFEDTNQKILGYAKEYSNKVIMGTTLTGLLCRDTHIIIFNIGDSRVYRYRDGFIKQLTKDQTFVQYLFDCGRITREELKNHPDKSILLQCLGGSAKENKINPQIIEIEGGFREDDIYLICTDGLYNMLDEDILERLLSEKGELSNIGRNLITEALDMGGDDNITLILIRKCEGREA